MAAREYMVHLRLSRAYRVRLWFALRVGKLGAWLLAICFRLIDNPGVVID